MGEAFRGKSYGDGFLTGLHIGVIFEDGVEMLTVL